MKSSNGGEDLGPMGVFRGLRHDFRLRRRPSSPISTQRLGEIGRGSANGTEEEERRREEGTPKKDNVN
eukprot:7512362-Prorocentrum_lima.AAC.1